MKTSKETQENISNFVDSYFNGDDMRSPTDEEDVLRLLSELSGGENGLGKDFIISFDCFCNVYSQQDGSTAAVYYSDILRYLIIINPMFNFSFPRTQDLTEAIIETNDAALTLEARLATLV